MIASKKYTLQHTATHCNTLQHTATHLHVGLDNDSQQEIQDQQNHSKEQEQRKDGLPEILKNQLYGYCT